MKTLYSLADHLSGVVQLTGEDVAITGVESDSREVKPGNLFIAVRGAVKDAAQFIEDAINKGAAAVVTENPPPPEGGVRGGVGENTRRPSPSSTFAKASADRRGECLVAWIQVKDSRAALSELAAAWYDRQPNYVAAVTGTDGKTSTADFFRQLCQLTDHPAASIGTLGVLGSRREYPALNTTPGPLLLHRTLSELAQDGITHVALEAASHGLDQHRMHGVHVQAAAFTNLTRDHLDYHKTVEAYLGAKLKLFSEVLEKGGAAIINADDANFNPVSRAAQERGAEVLSYGKAGKDYRLDAIRLLPHGIEMKTVLHGKPYAFTLPMIGTFQAMNLLAAMGLAEACGVKLEAMLKVIPQLKPVPGRLELAVTLKNEAPVFVDYAHTPAALENILKVVRPHIAGKLWVVFGCGGDRDKGKRPEMGKAAVQFADHAVVTDDNPRGEVPDTIRGEILAAAKGAENIGSRKEAIAFAVTRLRKGDGLVIAGKGHEKYQIYGNQTLPFDDVVAAREAAKGL